MWLLIRPLRIIILEFPSNFILGQRFGLSTPVTTPFFGAYSITSRESQKLITLVIQSRILRIGASLSTFRNIFISPTRFFTALSRVPRLIFPNFIITVLHTYRHLIQFIVDFEVYPFSLQLLILDVQKVPHLDVQILVQVGEGNFEHHRE